MLDKSEISKLYQTLRLSEAEKTALQFMASDLGRATELGTNGIARACYTSPATVVRLAKKLGYQNSTEMLYEFRHAALSTARSIASNTQSYLKFRPEDLTPFFDALDSKGFVSLSGSGYSEGVSEYFERKLVAFGCQTIQQRDLEPRTLCENFSSRLKVAIFISKSGETSLIVETARLLSEAHVPIITFTGNERSTLAQLASSRFVIQDDHPFDIENVEPNGFFAYCILAFEEVFRGYREREAAARQAGK